MPHILDTFSVPNNFIKGTCKPYITKTRRGHQKTIGMQSFNNFEIMYITQFRMFQWLIGNSHNWQGD